MALELHQCGCGWRHLNHPQPLSKMLCLPAPTGNHGLLPCQGPEVWEQSCRLGGKTLSGRAPLLGAWSLLIPIITSLLFSPFTLQTSLYVCSRNQLIPSSRPLPMLHLPPRAQSRVNLLLMSSSPQILQDLDRCHLLQKAQHGPCPNLRTRPPTAWGWPCACTPVPGLTCRSRARSTPARPRGCAGGSCPASPT